MDVHRHGIGHAFVRSQIDHALRKGIVQTFGLEQIVQPFHAISHHVRIDQLAAEMHLESVGWIATQHARLQHSLGIATCPGAAGDGRIDDLNLGVLLLVDVVNGIQAIDFTAIRPPREDFQLAAGISAGDRATAGGRRGRAASRERGAGRAKRGRLQHLSSGQLLHFFLLEHIHGSRAEHGETWPHQRHKVSGIVSSDLGHQRR